MWAGCTATGLTWRRTGRFPSARPDLLREQPVQAGTRQDLRARLSNRPSGGIVFATIQKFMPGEDEDVFPLLSDRRNIVVIADEATWCSATRTGPSKPRR